MATQRIQTPATNIATMCHGGHIRVTTIAAAAANAATTRVCPLGKLEPQYHCVSHSVGRLRLTTAFRIYTTIEPLMTETASSSASNHRLARTRAITRMVERAPRKNA